MSGAVDVVDRQADHHPDEESLPGAARQARHQCQAGGDPAERDERHAWGLEGTGNLGMGSAQHDHARADDDEGQQRSDVDELGEALDGREARAEGAQGARY